MPLLPLPPDPEPTNAQLAPYLSRVRSFDHASVKRWALDEWKKEMRKTFPDMFRQPYPFMGLKDYLWTDEWAVIRSRVMKAHNWDCAACSRKAKNVHHRDYRPRVLAGHDDTALIPLCNLCHELVHYGGEQKEEESILAAMVGAKDKDPSRGPGLPPPFKAPRWLPSRALANLWFPPLPDP